MIISTLQDFKNNIVDNNFNVNEYRCIVIPAMTEVTYGAQNDVDFQYCEEHNINCINLLRDGGSIIHFIGNVCWAEIMSNSVANFVPTNIRFLAALTEYLRNKGINAVQDNNDILIDDYKVASGCAINLGPDWKRTFSAVQINVNTDLDLIQHICTKPMKKIPKALSDYGITTEEMKSFVLNFFKKN